MLPAGGKEYLSATYVVWFERNICEWVNGLWIFDGMNNSIDKFVNYFVFNTSFGGLSAGGPRIRGNQNEESSYELPETILREVFRQGGGR